MKTLRTLLLATLVLAPALSHATAPRTGRYTLDGDLDICLQADNTWFEVNNVNFGGRWIYDLPSNTTAVFGGTATQSMSLVVKKNKASMTFWQSGMAFALYSTGLSFAFQSATCP